MIKNQNYFFPNIYQSIIHNKQPSDNIIRTIKNKKIVYCHGNINNINNNIIYRNLSDNKIVKNINDNKINNNINLQENENNKKRGQRGSKYRGVSKNGNQWQVLIMINKKKRYIGNYKNEEEAASSYDIVAIQNHGNKAKTNFYYTPEQIDKIKKMKNFIWN